MKYRIIIGGILLVALMSVSVGAQERGQYLPGFGGLNSGIQAPPGAT